MSITFRIGKYDITRNKHMSITFRIGKDDITRRLNTCLLPLELVKTKNTRNNPDQTSGEIEKYLKVDSFDTKALVGYKSCSKCILQAVRLTSR